MPSEIADFFRLRADHIATLREANTYSDCMGVYRACNKEKVFKVIAQKALVKASTCASTFTEYMTVYERLSDNVPLKNQILCYARRVTTVPEELATIGELARRIGNEKEWKQCALHVMRALRMHRPAGITKL